MFNKHQNRWIVMLLSLVMLGIFTGTAAAAAAKPTGFKVTITGPTYEGYKVILTWDALAFALTFLSLWWVDVTHALCRALECGMPLDQFYLGVGGGGARDALLLVPAMTAAMVAYATRRIRSRGEALVEL